MSTSPNLRLPYLDANQNQKSVTHNAALRMLDALVNLRVASSALSAPPAAPNDGQCWIVASGGTGAWLGKDFDVAAWQDGAWSFYAPNPGFVAYVDALGGALLWNGTAWVSLLGAVASLALSTLGIGTAADPANPLSARLNAALFSALPTTASPAGTGDVRVKLSKQGSGNTASLLFQDAYSGRAEIGLAGGDDFHVKVSSDGSTFYDAMVVTASGGAVSFLLTPTAPTAAAGDSSTKLATTAFVSKAVGAGGATGPVGPVPLKALAAWTTGTAYVAGPPASYVSVGGSSYGCLQDHTAGSFAGDLSAGRWGVVASVGATGPTGATGAAGFGRTQVNDAAYTAVAADRTVAYVALTAARTVGLPAASAYPAGAVLTVLDESGACSATATLTVTAAGSDRINGAASAVIAAPYGYLALESNTSNRWTVVDAPAPVTAVAGRTGAVALAVADVSGAAPLASPALTGTPTAPNAAAGTNSAQVATTSFVAASFVTFSYASANYATSASPTLTGTPTAPTPAAKDNSTRLATTAYADRGDAAQVARTQVNDAAYAVLPSDRTVAVVALTAARTLTLPAASAFPSGATLTVVDESGACSATNTVTLSAAGSDTVNGVAGAVLSTPYGYLALESNTSNKWTVVDQSTQSMAQQPATGVAITGGRMDGVAVGGTAPASGAFTTIAAASTATFSGIPQARNTTNNSYAGYWEVYTIDNIRRGYFGYGDASNNITMTGDNGWGVKIGGASCTILPALTLSSTLKLASYTVATLPAAGTAGRMVHCSNARMFNGAGTQEATGSGTGGPVVDNGSAWKVAGTNVTASA